VAVSVLVQAADVLDADADADADDDATGRARAIAWIMVVAIAVLAAVALTVVAPWSRPAGLPKLGTGGTEWTTRSMPMERPLPALSGSRGYLLEAACTGGGEMSIRISVPKGPDEGSGTVKCDGHEIFVVVFPGLRITSGAPTGSASVSSTESGPFTVRATVANGRVAAAEFTAAAG
jgi:hypothetical protein